MTFAAGDSIGPYRVVRPLGKGGMGTVYEVEHVRLGVRYALKAFTLDHGRVDFFRRRFLAEGRILARLDHPNIARVFDLNVLADGALAYFVMDLVRGEDGKSQTLANVGFGAVQDARAVRWFAQLASALDYIHALGIVHRDVKLNNILLDGKGDVTLGDFGISKFDDERIRGEVDLSRTRATHPDGASTGGSVMGTEGYLSPELLRGERATAASDVYALGVTFFRLLTGLWYEPGTKALRLLDSVGGAWSEVLGQMLAADASGRPSRLMPLAARLEAARGADAKRSRAARRTRTVIVFAALVAMGVLAFARFLRPSHDSDSTSAPDGISTSPVPDLADPAMAPVATDALAPAEPPPSAPTAPTIRDEGASVRASSPARPAEPTPPAPEKEPFRIFLDVEREIAVAFVECPPGECAVSEGTGPTARTRTVAIAYPYYLMAVPLTQREVDCLNPSIGERVRSAGAQGGSKGDVPVTDLTPEEIAALAAALTSRFPVPAEWGYECRLPTEAERDYARHLGLLSGDDPHVGGQPDKSRGRNPVRFVYAPRIETPS